MILIGHEYEHGAFLGFLATTACMINAGFSYNIDKQLVCIIWKMVPDQIVYIHLLECPIPPLSSSCHKKYGSALAPFPWWLSRMLGQQMSGICWPSIRDNHHGKGARADPYFLAALPRVGPLARRSVGHTAWAPEGREGRSQGARRAPN